MTLSSIANKMKREINAKSEDTGKLRTVRISVLGEIAESCASSGSDVAKKCGKVIEREIKRVYSEGTPPQRSQLQKAFANLNDHLNKGKKSAKKQSKKAA